MRHMRRSVKFWQRRKKWEVSSPRAEWVYSVFNCLNLAPIAATTGSFYEWVGAFLKKRLMDVSRGNLSMVMAPNIHDISRTKEQIDLKLQHSLPSIQNFWAENLTS